MKTPASLCVALLLALGCDNSNPPDDDAGPGTDAGATVDAGPGVDAGRGPLVVPATYAFESQFETGVSSVDHGGQAARQVLMHDITDYAAALTTMVDGDEGAFADGVDDGEVVSGLEYYFSISAADRSSDPIRLSTTPDTLQSTYGDLSGTAFLLEKLAGNDTTTDHQDWSTAFSGWDDASLAAGGGGIDTPTNFTRAIFHLLEDNAIAYDADPSSRQSPVDTPQDLPIHVTEGGVDLAALLGGFLHGAINFSQATDDYGDDDTAGKGLLSDNTMGEDPYTDLEHSWDEAFGYFGAAHDYDAFSASDIAGGEVARDSDADGRIDLHSEYNFGMAAEAGRRAEAATVTVDYGTAAFEAFRRGRAIITRAGAGGPLGESDLAALQAERDAAMNAWERIAGATIIHHLNVVLSAMADYGTAAFDHARFLELARSWSWMKGLSLMFQFNPRSQLTAAQQAQLAGQLRDAPVLPAEGDAAADTYRGSLRNARTLLATALSLPTENLGGDDGAGGW